MDKIFRIINKEEEKEKKKKKKSIGQLFFVKKSR
tara:strand:+ start:119 stop:220 length:102 start_codon:yes stop_codon:yes gene_type:complete